MDKKTAAILLASLMERIERDQSIGTVSSLERKALQIALKSLDLEGELAFTADPVLKPTSSLSVQNDATNGALIPPDTGTPIVIAEAPSAANTATPLLNISLVLKSIERDEITDSKVLMCLDFGTAMSKAFATVFPDQYLDLELGKEAGRQGYSLPSSVFIGDDGKAYFGFEALNEPRLSGLWTRAPGFDQGLVELAARRQFGWRRLLAPKGHESHQLQAHPG